MTPAGIEPATFPSIWSIILNGCPNNRIETKFNMIHTCALNCIMCRHPTNGLVKMYFYFITIIFPVVLYGCETWSLTLREERKPRAFDNMMLRRIFGSMRDEVMVEWKR